MSTLDEVIKIKQNAIFIASISKNLHTKHISLGKCYQGFSTALNVLM